VYLDFAPTSRGMPSTMPSEGKQRILGNCEIVAVIGSWVCHELANSPVVDNQNCGFQLISGKR